MLMCVFACTVLVYASGQGLTLRKASSVAQMSPSLVLLGAGANWAGANGTSALYVNWYDNVIAHPNSYCPDPAASLQTRGVTSFVLEQSGFNVTFVADIPGSVSGYDLLVIDSYWACEPPNEPIISDFVSNGGGVVLIGAVPRYLATYCKDMWPGYDLGPVQDWFGARMYDNAGGQASVVVDNPFGSSLVAGDSLSLYSGCSCAAVGYPLDDSTVVAKWENGLVFSLAHGYGQGRVFYQAAYDIREALNIVNVTRMPATPEYNSQVDITARIQNEIDVDEVILSYTQDLLWNNVTMSGNNGTFNATISPQSYGTLVQYRVYVSDTDGNWIFSSTYSYVVTDLTPPEIVAVNITPLEPTENGTAKIGISVNEPEDASGLQRVLFSFRDSFMQEWNTTMVYDEANGVWEVIVPRQPTGTNVEFFISAYDNAGNQVVKGYNYNVT